MDKGILADKKCKWILILLAFFAVLVNIKSIFTDYNYDSGYAVALAYRMVQGDAMFAEMWEPHQTSAFLCAGLIKLYLMVTDSVTGVVLYLQVAGVIIKALVTVLCYQATKRLVRKDILSVMCLFFFAVTPKGIPMPEFSNMQIWFSVGLFCCLVRFLQAQEKKGWLVAAGIFLCLEILAYPSCLLVYAGVIVLLLGYGKDKWKDILLFSGVCLGIGAVYCGYFVVRLGAKEFLESIGHIIVGDGSHDETLWEKCLAYLQEAGEMFIWLAGLGLAAGLVVLVVSVIMRVASKGAKRINLKRLWTIVFFLLFLLFDLFQALSVDMTYDERWPIYVPILILAILLLKKCNAGEKRIAVTGLLLSFLGFVATLLLTNLTISSSLNYLILAVMVSFLPIMKWLGLNTVNVKKSCLTYGVVLLFCAITIFRTGYITKCMSTEKITILDMDGKVKEGPAKGLVSEYFGPHMLNTTLTEWEEYIKPGDRVLVVSAGLYDPIVYLFEDVEICMTSTICTPTYGANLSEYWKQNPEKYPNVVIVDCWFGELRVEQNDWIMQWLKHAFGAQNYVDGNYWRYYRSGR